ncbi:hypothetical protein SAMN04488241_106110 [Sphingomonas rubra]|uniref:Uncharacterized protein n=1 Tax=Sphingomonas rubra TaxID=634430 RepID=A0A1I5SSC5_9SPHN|nr:hypothetical protein SAMN04488241_106110 [Sphingomonas rubra]
MRRRPNFVGSSGLAHVEFGAAAERDAIARGQPLSMRALDPELLK